MNSKTVKVLLFIKNACTVSSNCHQIVIEESQLCKISDTDNLYTPFFCQEEWNNSGVRPHHIYRFFGQLGSLPAFKLPAFCSFTCSFICFFPLINVGKTKKQYSIICICRGHFQTGFDSEAASLIDFGPHFWITVKHVRPSTRQHFASLHLVHCGRCSQ